jgi:hypothetical protein
MSGSRNRTVENLVTTVSRETWIAVETLLVGSGGMKVSRWLGLIARYRVEQFGSKKFDDAIMERVRAFEPNPRNVWIVGTVPKGYSGPRLGLSEAAWGRALVEWGLAGRIDAEELCDALAGIAAP